MSSVCDMCAHLGKAEGKACTFSGNCIVNTYNLHGASSFEKFMAPVAEEVVTEEAAVKVATVAEKAQSVFNPFQRGNGCLLEMVSQHTR